MIRRPFLAVPATTLVLLFAGTGILVHTHAQSLTEWAYPDWAAASAEARQSLTLACIWICGCSAWAATVHSGPASATCPIPAARNGAPLVLSHVSLLVAAATAGYVAGLAPLFAWTARHATYQADLRLGVILGGFEVLVASACFGYLCGAILPRLLAAPAAVMMAFGVIVAGGAEGRSWSPVWPFDVAAGIAESPTVTALRVVFFLTAATLLLPASAHWLRERRVTASNLARTAVLVAPVLLIAVVSGSRHTVLVQRDVRAEAVCDSIRQTQICVHPARRVMLPGLVEVVQQAALVLGAQAPLPRRVSDASLPDRSARGDLSLQLQDEDRDVWRAFAALDLAQSLLGTAQCPPGAEASGSTPGDVAEAAATWLAAQIDPRALTISSSGPWADLSARLQAQPPGDVQQRLRLALPDVLACRATVEDLLLPS